MNEATLRRLQERLLEEGGECITPDPEGQSFRKGRPAEIPRVIRSTSNPPQLLPTSRSSYPTPSSNLQTSTSFTGTPTKKKSAPRSSSDDASDSEDASDGTSSSKKKQKTYSEMVQEPRKNLYRQLQQAQGATKDASIHPSWTRWAGDDATVSTSTTRAASYEAFQDEELSTMGREEASIILTKDTKATEEAALKLALRRSLEEARRVHQGNVLMAEVVAVETPKERRKRLLRSLNCFKSMRRVFCGKSKKKTNKKIHREQGTAQDEPARNTTLPSATLVDSLHAPMADAIEPPGAQPMQQILADLARAAALTAETNNRLSAFLTGPPPPQWAPPMGMPPMWSQQSYPMAGWPHESYDLPEQGLRNWPDHQPSPSMPPIPGTATPLFPWQAPMVHTGSKKPQSVGPPSSYHKTPSPNQREKDCEYVYDQTLALALALSKSLVAEGHCIGTQAKPCADRRVNSSVPGQYGHSMGESPPYVSSNRYVTPSQPLVASEPDRPSCTVASDADLSGRTDVVVVHPFRAADNNKKKNKKGDGLHPSQVGPLRQMKSRLLGGPCVGRSQSTSKSTHSICSAYTGRDVCRSAGPGVNSAQSLDGQERRSSYYHGVARVGGRHAIFAGPGHARVIAAHVEDALGPEDIEIYVSPEETQTVPVKLTHGPQSPLDSQHSGQGRARRKSSIKVVSGHGKREQSKALKEPGELVDRSSVHSPSTQEWSTNSVFGSIAAKMNREHMLRRLDRERIKERKRRKQEALVRTVPSGHTKESSKRATRARHCSCGL